MPGPDLSPRYGPQGRADRADGGPIDRRRAGCPTSCSGVTKNRHWSIQTFSFSDAEVDAEWDMIYGYARVSTDAQDLAIQLETLKAAGCERVFHDKEGGDSADRLQLKRLMKRLSAGDERRRPTASPATRPTCSSSAGTSAPRAPGSCRSPSRSSTPTRNFGSWWRPALGLRPSSSCGVSGSARRRAGRPPRRRG